MCVSVWFSRDYAASKTPWWLVFISVSPSVAVNFYCIIFHEYLVQYVKHFMESPFLPFHILGVFTPESSLIYAICEAYNKLYMFIFFCTLLNGYLKSLIRFLSFELKTSYIL